MTVFYIGPESSTYHTRRECPSLHRSNRYWSIDSAKSVEAIREKRPHDRPRTLCRLCQKASR